MFLPDWQPITVDLPTEWEFAHLYFVHDLHYGSELFDERKWMRLKNRILSDKYGKVLFIGDLFENAIPGSKSDMFTQTANPAEQKEFVTQQFVDLKEQTIAIVPGNHCSNRTTKAAGLYPLYDCALLAGMGEKYRNIIAFLNIGVGTSKKNKSKQVHYFGQIQHKAKDCKNYGTSDFTDGIDFFAFGHDHNPRETPRAKLVFDKQNNVIYKRNIENIDCGSFCQFGGYGAEAGYRPQSDKMYMLTIFGEEKRMETSGFYLS